MKTEKRFIGSFSDLSEDWQNTAVYHNFEDIPEEWLLNFIKANDKARKNEPAYDPNY